MTDPRTPPAPTCQVCGKPMKGERPFWWCESCGATTGIEPLSKAKESRAVESTYVRLITRCSWCDSEQAYAHPVVHPPKCTNCGLALWGDEKRGASHD